GRDAPIGGIADASQAVIVNGPIRRDLQINCGLGLFGPGWRANATVGRALGLIARSSFPGAPSFGDPGQYTMCFGEDEEATRWTPLHVDGATISRPARSRCTRPSVASSSSTESTPTLQLWSDRSPPFFAASHRPRTGSQMSGSLSLSSWASSTGA